MARKSSAFEDIIEITARFPWWVGLLLALGFYLWLHDIAITEVVKPSTFDQMGEHAQQIMFSKLAGIGQYILPIAFVIGSALSALGRLKRISLHKQAKTTSGADAIQNMSWQEFEMLIGEAFRNKGFSVHETTSGADGGVDLELRKGQELKLVQCKHWRASKVRVDTIRELYGVMADRSATGGYVVTSGRFTQDAIEFAKGKDLILIDGPKLKTLLGVSSIESRKQPPLNIIPATNEPLCPKCHSVMIKRVAKKGVHSGKDFWGCSKFPSCRAIVQIR